ncbi:hypothetical protein K0M31_005664 [Melipona bicolor]|uniref:Heparan sulfate 2-O-sulfotransferase pipe n=1 Tax=Melipona bicolor TaxID=60889 RepID=A0AA40FTU5_9HYME|nr:hypothetical protein K0M31_005664 [Melipona bicolor]
MVKTKTTKFYNKFSNCPPSIPDKSPRSITMPAFETSMEIEFPGRARRTRYPEVTFNLPQPIYINIVRDPVERVISWYYYVRAPWYYVERKQIFPDLPLPDPNWLKKDFESCVLKADRECRYLEGEIHEGIGDHRRQTLFFCGHSEKCTPFNTVGALERAKMAVEKHYAVVGVLEDVNTTLTVLENYIPRFFRGATDVYYDEVNAFTRINRNFFKPPVSEEVKDMVRGNFTREIEFYQFCKQRLYKQLRALKLTRNTYETNSL